MSPIAIIAIAAFFYILGRFFSNNDRFDEKEDLYYFTHPKFSRQYNKNKKNETAIYATLIFVILLAIALVIGDELMETEISIVVK